MAALHYGAGEEAFGEWARHEVGHRHRAPGLAKEREVVGVTAERADVVADPGQGREHVTQAEVRRRALDGQEAVNPEAVVQRATHTAPERANPRPL